MERNILETLINNGFSQRKIAAELGVGQTSVKYWIKKHGLKTQHTDREMSSFEEITERGSRCCTKCKIEKPISEFYISRGKSRTRYAGICKECQRLTMRRVLRDGSIKHELADKLGGKCIICGYDRCLRALDFHHRDPHEKEYTMSDLVSWGKLNKERAELELSKCVLLCANCHREIHAGLVQLPNQERE